MEPLSAWSPTQATSKKQEPAKHPFPCRPRAGRIPGSDALTAAARQGPERLGRGCGSPGRGHSLTCLSLSCSILARRFLSGGERYFCVSNFFSNSMVWSLEKRTCPPFLLCSGRWMKGLHSSGFPTKRGTAPRVTGRPRTRVTGEPRPCRAQAW